MNKIPFIKYKNLEEMRQANELMSSLYGTIEIEDVDRLFEMMGGAEGYIVDRYGVNKFGPGVPWDRTDPKSNYVEVKLTFDMEND